MDVAPEDTGPRRPAPSGEHSAKVQNPHVLISDSASNRHGTRQGTSLFCPSPCSPDRPCHSHRALRDITGAAESRSLAE